MTDEALEPDNNTRSAGSFWFRNRLTVFQIVIFLVLPLLFSSASTAFLYERDEWLRSYGFISLGAIALMSIFTMAFALTPSTFIAAFSAYVWGWAALPFVVIAYIMASLLGFFIGRTADKGRFLATLNESKKGQRALRFCERLQSRSFVLVFLIRLTPVLPFAVSNVLLAVQNIRLRPFLIGGTLGMLPRTVLSFWAGMQVQGFVQHKTLPTLQFWLTLLSLLAGVSLLGWLFRRAWLQSEI